ncbi:hypothetical protein SAMN05216456_1622 [Devosia crocina]|uniref:Carboxypeptidase regulatory-like domain-containing protein n=1 Tax=Devosia crocina TaxID=429728 RepID=A0A1I7NCE2_9HYPH|nr:hypothetical protein [Devosia crocina]SFV32355.1 hypothetical protein SAMN05216456_1622 [Devosia crocina]
MLPVSRLITGVLFGLSSLVLPPATPSVAQDTTEIPPLPRPRPDRDAAQSTPTPTGTTAADAIAAVTDVPQAVTLTARITQDGPTIPEGVVWRVYETAPDAAGNMQLVAKSEAATAQLELPPGQYVVHAAYGRAQLSEPLSVAPGQNEKVIDLEAGALRLNSAVTGDIPIAPTQLRFDIFTAGSESDRVPIAEGLPPNDIVTLNAGTYHIVSHFGTINATVRADLRVEPGELTDATLYHHASEVSLKLVSEEGGEAIADVEWTIQTAEGATVFTERGAFPSTVLAEGVYVILAKQGEQVYNREVEIVSGGSREIEVLTSVYQGT